MQSENTVRLAHILYGERAAARPDWHTLETTTPPVNLLYSPLMLDGPCFSPRRHVSRFGSDSSVIMSDSNRFWQGSVQMRGLARRVIQADRGMNQSRAWMLLCRERWQQSGSGAREGVVGLKKLYQEADTYWEGEASYEEASSSFPSSIRPVPLYASHTVHRQLPHSSQKCHTHSPDPDERRFKWVAYIKRKRSPEAVALYDAAPLTLHIIIHLLLVIDS